MAFSKFSSNDPSTESTCFPFLMKTKVGMSLTSYSAAISSASPTSILRKTQLVFSLASLENFGAIPRHAMPTIEEIRRIPKVELHAHLNGSISVKTMRRLAGNETVDNLVIKQATTMEEVFKLFPLVQKLTSNKENLTIATEEVLEEFADDGVIYLELRTTPKRTESMCEEEYVKTVIDCLKRKQQTIVTKLILSIDRRMTLEQAGKVVNMAVNDESGFIVGIDLSGDPSLDGTKFIPYLQRARDTGLGIAVHLAEIKSNLAEVTQFLDFGPDRIGHGTFLHTSQQFVDQVVAKRIPLEVCLTSNVMCKTTRTVKDSHFMFWRNKDVIVCVCTDDKGLMTDCSLSSEMKKASDTFGLSLVELKTIAKKSFDVSFGKKKLPKNVVDEIEKGFFE